MAEEEFKNPYEPGSSGVEVHRVAVRVLPFYPERPSLWFAQLESQFVLAGITTDYTKSHYALSQLDSTYALEVEDIIELPPTTSNKYERFKAELIKRLSASRDKKVKQLLTYEELGDRKPSQFLRHLVQLAGPGVPEDFIRTIWNSRLPSSKQSIIAAQTKATLEETADLADRIHDVVMPGISSSVSAVSAENKQITELTRQAQMLTEKLERMSRPKKRLGKNAYKHRRERSSSTRSTSNYRKFPNCWYHAKFGGNAKKCIKPCDFSGKVEGNHRWRPRIVQVPVAYL